MRCMHLTQAMQRNCCSLLIASSLLLLLLTYAAAMPVATTTAPLATTPVGTSKPKLIVSIAEEPKPMMYHFIIDQRPTSMGQNYYIKPGQEVGTFNLDSNTLTVRLEDSKRPISSKLNILFVAQLKEQERAATARSKFSENLTL